MIYQHLQLRDDRVDALMSMRAWQSFTVYPVTKNMEAFVPYVPHMKIGTSD